MSWKKCHLIVITSISLGMLMVLYNQNYLRLWLMKDNQQTFLYVDGNNLLDGCILSFIMKNDLTRDLIDRSNDSYPIYKSFHSKPLKYDNIGKECASRFYNGQQNTTMKSSMKSCFYPFTISENKKEILRQRLLLIKEKFEENNLELVLTGGSFIGSWRYHGMIPYDDDIDFYILHHQKPRVRDLLETLSLNRTNKVVFKDTELTNQHWKFGVICQDQYLSSCFLQIDFFFMWKDGNEMRFLESPGSFKIKDYYPLQLRPFEDVLFMSPKNFRAFLFTQYSASSPNVCQFKNHANNAETCAKSTVDCGLLRFMYPYKLTGVYKSLTVEIIVHEMTVRSVFIFISPS